MRKPIYNIAILFAVALSAHAHFVFVVPQAGNTNASVFISETLKPDPQVDIDIVKDTKLSLRDTGGRETALTLAKSGEAYTTTLVGSGTRVIHGLADLGISGSGDKQYLLLYHPKAILGNAFDSKTVVGKTAPTELVPIGKAGALKLQLLGRGKPQADAEVTVLLPDGTEKLVKTDKSGQTETFTQNGRYGAWARFWETTASGERDGKKYPETHHYATLVFDTQPSSTTASLFAKLPAAFATLPEATASFGSATSDGWLYVYGGHISPTHNYFVGAVSGRFSRLRLNGEPAWEELPPGPPAQGLNLAVHKGKVYRVGGMTPRNEKGKPADNHSIADVARFDPATKKWEALPSLPEGRSSHDVVVIGDQLFVTGGWNMNGDDEEWAKTTLVMDLSAKKLEWASIPQPFERRALMAAALNGKLYVIGGINKDEDIETTVSILDPKTKTWSNGTPLPKSVLGFAPAAGVHKGSLYVSVADGTLYRLNAAGTEWAKTSKTTPRVAHRLASHGDSILVIGGAANGKNSDLIEAVKP